MNLRPEALSASSEPVQPARAEAPDSRAPIQTWRGLQISEHVLARSLDKSYRYWLYHRASRQVRLRDMCAHLTSVDNTLLAMKTEGDYLAVSQSYAYIVNVGRDLRGCLMSELKFGTANSMCELYDEILETGKPIYARYISSLSNEHTYWECLLLPISSDGRSRPTFVFNHMARLSDKADILQVLFDRSMIGMLAAVPILDGRNKTDDARILTLNPRARELLQVAQNRTFDTIGELLQHTHTELKWGIIRNSSEGQTTVVEYRDQTEKEFVLTIELINQFFLISIAERVHDDDNKAEPTQGRLARLLRLS